MIRHFMAIAIVLVSGMVSAAWGATAAGTIIRNQASATYLDAGGRQVSVTSNLVETLVQQVGGVELVADQQHRGIAGSTVRFTHRIRNTGNDTDRYDLLLDNIAGDDFNLSTRRIYADTDRNGIPDNETPISISDWMAAGSHFDIVIEARVPDAANSTDMAQLRITATSAFDPSVSTTNTDTVLVADGATLRVTKSISSTQGQSPSGAYSVRLRYENTGVSTADSVIIIDALPAGMSYVSGSALWSESSNALTDANATDMHTGPVSTARYCAYDVSCTGLSEAQLDADSDSRNQVTFMLDTLVAGDVGVLSFDVSIDAGLLRSELVNEAEYEFNSGGSTVAREFSNPVGFSVLPVAGVVANGSTVTSVDNTSEPVSAISAAQGGVVVFDNIIWNTGNDTDTFNIELQRDSSTMPAGSTFRLLRSDGATPLQDTNNDGVPDTGPIAPGAFVKVVLSVTLPSAVSGNNGGNGFNLTKLARSVSDSTVFNAVTDLLDNIVANQVDMTNQAPFGSAGALGAGPGPEALPVSTLSPDAHGVALIDLYVQHQGGEPDTYVLAAFGSATGDPLPEGWSWRFLDPTTNTVLVDTGAMAPGASRHIIARISVPADTQPGTTSIFFEARSQLSGASDLKHDAIATGANDALNMEPSLSAQLEPGNWVVYRHTLTNTGSVNLNDINLQLSHSMSGWTGSLYNDSNANGLLDSTDTAFSGPATLAPGEFMDIFVKVFAPANALAQDRNISSLQASWNAGADTLQVTDTSTITATHVSIRKEQAVDLGCDGTPDTGASFTQARFAVPPGNNCVVYRLTAVNTGLETSYNVMISDKTPSFTRYQTPASCSRVPCWLAEPGNEGSGPVSAQTDQLLPGEKFHLTFSVRIE